MKNITRSFRYIFALFLVAIFIVVRSVQIGHENIPAPAIPERIHKIQVTYDVYAAGFKSLNATLNINLGQRSYEMSFAAETQGFIGRFFPWSTSMSTHGRINEGGVLVPVLHKESSTWRKNTSISEMGYDAHGSTVKMTTQDAGEPSVDVHVDNSLSDQANDVLTATLFLMRNSGSLHKCTGRSPAFDGQRRFDITLTDDGIEILPHSGYSRFEGEAMRCILKVEPGPGFQPKDKKRGWMAVQNYTEARHKPPLIWFARMGDSDQMVPVRMEIASAYGSAVANLASWVENKN